MDAHNLHSAIEFVRKNKPKQIRVDIKGWVRIRRDLKNLSILLDESYLRTPVEYRWLWHEKKALMRLSKVQVLGVSVVWVR